MSGFKDAVWVESGIVVIPRTCDGDGAWECDNLVEPGQRLCGECMGIENGENV
jgi:hypothetical protein